MAKRETVFDEFEQTVAYHDDALEDDPGLGDDSAWRIAAEDVAEDFDRILSDIEDRMGEGVFLIRGTFGAWDGPHRVATFIEDAKGIREALDIRGDSSVSIITEGPHLYIEQSHHDGHNSYELRRLSPKGLQRYAGWLERGLSAYEMLATILKNERTYTNAFGALYREHRGGRIPPTTHTQKVRKMSNGMNMIEFAVAHATQAECAMALYNAAHPENPATEDDVDVFGTFEAHEDYALFGFRARDRLVCVCAHRAALTPQMMDAARKYRLALIADHTDILTDGDEVEVEQFGAPMTEDLMDQGIALIRGLVDDPEALRMLSDMNAVYSYRVGDARNLPEPDGNTKIIAVPRP